MVHELVWSIHYWQKHDLLVCLNSSTCKYCLQIWRFLKMSTSFPYFFVKYGRRFERQWRLCFWKAFKMTSGLLYGMFDFILRGIWAKCQIQIIRLEHDVSKKKYFRFSQAVIGKNIQPHQQEIPKAGLYLKCLLLCFIFSL